MNCLYSEWVAFICVFKVIFPHELLTSAHIYHATKTHSLLKTTTTTKTLHYRLRHWHRMNTICTIYCWTSALNLMEPDNWGTEPLKGIVHPEWERVVVNCCVSCKCGPMTECVTWHFKRTHSRKCWLSRIHLNINTKCPVPLALAWGRNAASRQENDFSRLNIAS